MQPSRPWLRFSVLKTPVKHVPGKQKPGRTYTAKSKQGLRDTAPQPALRILPRADCVIDCKERADHAYPANDLNYPHQRVGARAQHSYVFQRHRKEQQEGAKKDEIRKTAKSCEQTQSLLLGRQSKGFAVVFAKNRCDRPKQQSQQN